MSASSPSSYLRYNSRRRNDHSEGDDDEEDDNDGEDEEDYDEDYEDEPKKRPNKKRSSRYGNSRKKKKKNSSGIFKDTHDHYDSDEYHNSRNSKIIYSNIISETIENNIFSSRSNHNNRTVRKRTPRKQSARKRKKIGSGSDSSQRQHNKKSERLRNGNSNRNKKSKTSAKNRISNEDDDDDDSINLELPSKYPQPVCFKCDKVEPPDGHQPPSYVKSTKSTNLMLEKKGRDTVNRMIRCNFCIKWYHLACMNPPRKTMPIG